MQYRGNKRELAHDENNQTRWREEIRSSDDK